MRVPGPIQGSWSHAAHLKRVSVGEATRAARARELLLRKEQSPVSSINPAKPELTKPVFVSSLRYRRSLSGDSHSADAANEIISAIYLTANDRRDRVVLAWPCRPDGAFVAGALSLIEKRLLGDTQSMTLALWPWRQSVTRGAKSIFVEAQELIQHSKRRVNGQSHGSSTFEMICLRLSSLLNQPEGYDSKINVKMPTLFELISVFRPAEGEGAYKENSGHFLHRVRKHTELGGRKPLSSHHLQELNDPSKTTFALYGLSNSDPAILLRHLRFPRFDKEPLGAILIDLTRSGLSYLGDQWQSQLGDFLKALPTEHRQRPPVIAITEDAFTAKKAEAAIKEAGQAIKPRRIPPEMVGLLLSRPGFLGAGSSAFPPLPTFEVRADLKDGRLLRLRDDVLRAARSLEDAGDRDSAAVLRAGLSFIRHVACLPMGMSEGREVIETIYVDEDDADKSARRRFYPATALHPLTEQIRISPNSEQLKTFKQRFEELIEPWQQSTPVSLKLSTLSLSLVSAAHRTMLVLPDRHTANVYKVSDTAIASQWHVADVRDMIAVAAQYECDHWIIVKPTSDTLRVMLAAVPGPRRIDLIGDAAGTALLEAELKPIATLPAMAPMRQRAQSLLNALGHASSNLGLDHEETVARSFAGQKLLDFSRGSDQHTGPIVKVSTENGYLLVYRPGSEVLRHTPDDLRAFEQVEAKYLTKDDVVLVLTQPLMELLRRALAKSPKIIETLRAYHTQIAVIREGLPGDNLRDKARNLVRKIQSEHPNIPDREVNNVVRWLDVDETTLDDPSAQPQAPQTKERFMWFMNALNVLPVLSNAWWDHGIKLTRSYHLSEGMQFNQRAVSFILDPESLKARGIGVGIENLQQAIMENLDTVLRIETSEINRMDKKR